MINLNDELNESEKSKKEIEELKAFFDNPDDDFDYDLLGKDVNDNDSSQLFELEIKEKFKKYWENQEKRKHRIKIIDDAGNITYK